MEHQPQRSGYKSIPRLLSHAPLHPCARRGSSLCGLNRFCFAPPAHVLSVIRSPTIWIALTPAISLSFAKSAFLPLCVSKAVSNAVSRVVSRAWLVSRAWRFPNAGMNANLRHHLPASLAVARVTHSAAPALMNQPRGHLGCWATSSRLRSFHSALCNGVNPP